MAINPNRIPQQTRDKVVSLFGEHGDIWQTAPHEVERDFADRIVGALLVADREQRRAVGEELAKIGPGEWFAPHCYIIEAAERICDRDTPEDITIVTLTHELDRMSNPEDTRGELLAEMAGTVYDTADVALHVRELLRCIGIRKMECAAERIREDLAAGNLGDAVGTFSDIVNRYGLQRAHGPTLADLSEWLTTPAPEPELLFKGNLPIPRRIVALFSGTGKLGKTYFAMMVSLCAAMGKAAFPFLEPTSPLKTLGLFGEEAEAMVRSRIKNVADYFECTPDEQAQVLSNLHIVCGIAEPLFEVGQYGRAMQPTSTFGWLRNTIKEREIDLVVVDPLSRWGGLADENSNAPAGQVIGQLQNLATETGCSVLVLHHATKDGTRTRGASALQDGSRWAAELQAIPEDDVKRFAIEDPARYVQLIPVKNSYAELWGSPIYLRREAGGVLVQADPRRDVFREIAEMIAQWMDANAVTLTEDELRCRPKAKALRDALKGAYPDTRREDYVKALHTGANLSIFTTKIEARGPNTVTVYTVTEVPF